MTNSKHPSPKFPSLPSSGQEIYNSIMQQIEPELMIPAVHDIKEKYKDESPEKKRQRTLRYKQAFKKYWEMYEKVTKHLGDKIEDYVRDMFCFVEELYKDEETRQLKAVEHSIHQAP